MKNKNEFFYLLNVIISVLLIFWITSINSTKDAEIQYLEQMADTVLAKAQIIHQQILYHQFNGNDTTLIKINAVKISDETQKIKDLRARIKIIGVVFMISVTFLILVTFMILYISLRNSNKKARDMLLNKEKTLSEY